MPLPRETHSDIARVAGMTCCRQDRVSQLSVCVVTGVHETRWFDTLGSRFEVFTHVYCSHVNSACGELRAWLEVTKVSDKLVQHEIESTTSSLNPCVMYLLSQRLR